MSWRSHVQKILDKASKRLNLLKSLKYRVSRSTLACLYKSLIRPLMEYGDIIWDNCSECDSQLLESIQYESAKIVTGAIKGTSARVLRNELAWEDLGTRRKMHKLAHFYKIAKRISPSYLTELLPDTMGERVHFSLRSNENFCSFLCRTVRFQQSFFPEAINLWNSLSVDTRNSISLLTFKAKLRLVFCPLKYNKLFDFSLTRQTSILHTRLRLGFCALNDYLFKINCCASPRCDCGMENETIKHYFLSCPRFAAQRVLFLASSERICGSKWSASSIRKKMFYILNGIEDISYEANCAFFREVQNFILISNRFSLAFA